MKKIILSFLIVGVVSFSISCEKTADVAAGKAKFDQNCAPCHGSSGKGDGPAAAVLNPKPRNFTDQAYMSKRTNAQLSAVIKNGGAANGFSAMMAPWAGVLSDADIANVVAYVRTLK
ncbi:MAG: cytochrome c [Deltaproteobacteria bacterium]|nr:cytochrome c [Deltaproteobacteria bacterium]